MYTDQSKSEHPQKGRFSQTVLPKLLIWLPLLIIWLWLWQGVAGQGTMVTIPYSEFKDKLKNKEIIELSLSESEISGLTTALLEAGEGTTSNRPLPPWRLPLTAKAPEASSSKGDGIGLDASNAPKPKPVYFRTVRVEDPKLIEELSAAGVRYTGVTPSIFTQLLMAWVIPLLFLLLIWIYLSRKFMNAGASLMSVGKSRAKLMVDRETGVRFDDVAGCDEAKYELQEVVDFLKSPERYKSLGATIPKGVLLLGPPGTGKTLLARAVAGEAKVPFFSISGSDFVEMFVGVGAARVRDLFAEAKKSSPCIVFIDEIDTVGRHRAVQAGVVNDEREQTLNQLLSEMDGFEPNVGVIVLAATNRPEVLDRALLRPGRFDRQIVIDAPDKFGRKAILVVHAQHKPLAKDVDLAKIAQITPGLSGADLANTVNEAALLATRRNRAEITQQDFIEAIEKVMAGPERKSHRLDEKEKARVAYHESGHALVAAFCKEADPVHKISIVPRGKAALGYTLQLPERENLILTQGALMDRIRGLLGGRAAEELVFNEISTGAENDLDKATVLAEQMICFYGMGRTGLTHFGERRPLYLVQGLGETITKNCSPDTARRIDEEIDRILSDCYRDAKDILKAHRMELDAIATELLRKETIEEIDLKALLKKFEIEGNLIHF